jgi:glutamate--cysteine ligase
LNNTGFTLKGFEDLEISTQILIRDAMNRSIDVSVLDRKNNFVELKKNGRTELVKQATKTSKDSYVSYLIMENKTVSKRLLAEHNLLVPGGDTFEEPSAALKYCQQAAWDKIVIKPATTNYGLGITMAASETDASVLEHGIAGAFSLADTILVEEFVVGDEYRFLVVDFKTVAICRRIPANLVGDGVSTIEELVAKKNADPRRGQGYITPLEKIQLSKTELSIISDDYGYHEKSVPPKGETVLLRKNSNISTGGDSIDATDDVDPFYNRIAEQAAKLVDASICGVDLILPHPGQEDDYAVLELNFNPVLYIHNYPYEGQNREVGEKILDLLGF